MEKQKITLETLVKAPVEKAWKCWNTPEDVIHWNNASDDWHTPQAENDLKPGGKFNYLMAARDGSMQFNFGGIYDDVQENRYLAYTLGDGRRVEVHFTPDHGYTQLKQTFETEQTNPVEMQRQGWKAIMDNYKKYVENKVQEG